jgi:hypothetical protein
VRPTGFATRGVDLHALSHLRYIRETMSSASAFTAISGRGATAMGLTAFFAAWLAHRQDSEARWLAVWLTEAALAFAIGSVTSWRKARRAGTPLWGSTGRRFILSCAAPIVAGVIQTAALYRADLTAFLPGMWLLLYGTAAVSGGASSILPIRLAGACFMTLGAAALWAPTSGGDWFMALGFGLCQTVFGLIIAVKYER